MNDKELRPHPTKAAKHTAEIEAFAAEFLRDVVEPMSSVLRPLEEKEGPQDVEYLKSAVLSVALNVAGACAAGGASRPMKRLFNAVRDLAPSFEQRKEAKLAERELDAFVLLTWGRHLAADAKLRASRKAFDAAKGALVHEDGAALATIIDEAKAQGVAVKTALSVTGRDGFGAGFWGAHDRREDGSYLTTYAIGMLFLPVFPLCTYRVTEDVDGFHVFRRLPLSGLLVWSRLIAPALVALVVGWIALSSYQNSPDRIAEEHFANAHKAIGGR